MAGMPFQKLSQLNDGKHIAWAYCAGRDGGPPCGHGAKLDMSALILEHGDIGVNELRARVKCPKCGSRAVVTVSHR